MSLLRWAASHKEPEPFELLRVRSLLWHTAFKARSWLIRAMHQSLHIHARKGEIIHYHAINRWDEEDEFDEWAKPLVALSPEAERILGVTNSQLAHCRSTDLVLAEFLTFLDR